MPAIGDLLFLPHVDHDPIPDQGYAVCYEQPAQQARAMAVFVHIGAEKAALPLKEQRTELTRSPSPSSRRAHLTTFRSGEST